MTNFFNFSQLNQLHIELTNACNAACPMCVRFHGNSPLLRPDIEIDQITIDKFKKYFPPEVLQKCELILFCGVHGDPGMAKDLYEICDYIASSTTKTSVRLHTNGGMRKPEFWERIGKLFASKTIDSTTWRITFSVDGLEDTNHLYRRNVEWSKLIANITAFINAGGFAEWDYLIFKHNEHQISQAKELSNSLGFKNFFPKKSLGVDNGTGLKRMAVMSREGTLDYWIDAPEDPKNRSLENPQGPVEDRVWNFNVRDYQRLKEGKQTYNNYADRIGKVYTILKAENNEVLDKAVIKCKSETQQGGREVFVDQKGRVIPCCYIGTHVNGVYLNSQSLQLNYEMDKYGWDKFDLNLHSLEEILEAHHLDRVFTDSWNKPSCAEGKMSYCANTCGTYSAIDKLYTHETIEDKSRIKRNN